jgi:hypothetical protein
MQRFARTLLLVALAMCCVSATAFAQLQENLGALSGDNAKGYLQPLAKGLSATMNSSIWQTGRVPKEGFFISFGARLAGVNFSDDDKTYTPTDPTGFTGTAPVKAPTVLGDRSAVAQPGVGGTTLLHPGGFEVGEFAFGSPQLYIGSLYGTVATVRFLTIDIGDSDLGKFDLLGLGAMHSISQYIEDAPFDLAFGIFWQQFKIDDKLVDTNAFNVSVMGSKEYGWIQPYVGLGFDTFNMESEYKSSSSSIGTVNVEFDTESNFHGTLGGLAKFGILGVFGEVNVAARTGLALGFNVGSF